MKRKAPRRKNRAARRTAQRLAKIRKARLRTAGKLRKKRNGRLGY